MCHMAKSSFKPDLYSSLLVLVRPWEDVSLDFIAVLPCTQRGKDFIMVVVDKISKMAHFIDCHKVDDACNIAGFYYNRLCFCMGSQRPLFQIWTPSF